MKPQGIKETGWTKQKAVLVAVTSTICVSACCSLPSLRAAVRSSGLWLLPDLDQQSSKGLEIYDRDDKYLCTLFDGKDKELVPLSKVFLPQLLPSSPLIERGMNHVQDPSTEKPKEEKEDKKDSKKDEDEDETEEFVLNLSQ